MSDKIKKGSKGEQLAATFLKEKGFEIVAQNLRQGKSEIDLIAKKDEWLIFIEVKTRSSSAYGEPEDFVDALKASFITRAAEEYIYATNWQGHVRFDVIAVHMTPEIRIEHFEDAFY